MPLVFYRTKKQTLIIDSYFLISISINHLACCHQITHQKFYSILGVISKEKKSSIVLRCADYGMRHSSYYYLKLSTRVYSEKKVFSSFNNTRRKLRNCASIVTLIHPTVIFFVMSVVYTIFTDL